jgi:hypothetical protein
MKTDDLVTMLATGTEAVDPREQMRRAAVAIGAGVLVAAIVMASWLGVRWSMVQDMASPMLWAKFAFVAWLTMAGSVATLRLARPGARLARVPLALVAPVLLMWLLAVIALAGADAPRRAELLLGQTWSACPVNIPVLSLPIFIAAMWGMKGLAPTQLRLAGATAGLFAGAAGAFVYAFHCPELAAPFLGVWYVIGILVPAALGALIGPLVLRW